MRRIIRMIRMASLNILKLLVCCISGKRRGKFKIKEKVQIEAEVFKEEEKVTIFEYEKGLARDNNLSSDMTVVDANDDTEEKDKRVSR